MASSLIISWQIEVGKVEAATDFIFLGSKITSDSDFINEIKRHLLLGSKAMTTLHSILKSRDITLPAKVCIVKAMVSPVIMYGCELDYKEGWAPNNWCFWIVVLEKTLGNPLDFKEIKPVNPKRNQPQIFIGWTDAEAEAPILWPPEELTRWKRPWCWERPKAKGERGGKGWDGWIESSTQWTWIWANSGR